MIILLFYALYHIKDKRVLYVLVLQLINVVFCVTLVGIYWTVLSCIIILQFLCMFGANLWF